MPIVIGQFVGRYQVLQQLGEGGMAVVYKARDARLDRDVAIKVIRQENITADQLDRFLKRFEREAKALAGLSHPNIVGVLDFGEHEGSPYLVMEYLAGGTLKKWLETPIPWHAAAQLLLPVAKALQYAHQQGVIHRDIKPANILLTSSSEPMLSDFGIVKILDREKTVSLTETGIGIGTPEYMAPEQALGQAVDGRADLYALGTVLYEMITGRKLFPADTPMSVLYKKTTEPPPRPSQYVRDLPEAVEHVLLRSLARDPAERYQNAEEMVKVLAIMAAGSLPPMPGELEKKRKIPAWGIAVGIFSVCLCLSVMGGGAYAILQPIQTKAPSVQSSQIFDTPVPSETIQKANPGVPTNTLIPSPAMLTPTNTATRTSTPIINTWKPLANCASSRLHVGDSAYVGYGGGANSIRSSPDTHPQNNKIAFAQPGQVLTIVGGPECSYGWIMWEVRYDYDPNDKLIQGWTPESDGSEFFLEPIVPWTACQGLIKSRLHIGDSAMVALYPDTRNNVMDAGGSVIGKLDPGDRMTILDGPACRNGRVLWQIRALSGGLTGWTTEGISFPDYYLVPIISGP